MSSSPISSSSSEAPLFAGLLDVPCEVEVIVGHGTIAVRECLDLRPGSVIALAQPAGSDLQVHVQGVPIALGEVVIDDETTSVRVSAIVPPPDAEAGL